MFVRQPELLVFDDLSALWMSRLNKSCGSTSLRPVIWITDAAATDWTPTCLVVSHRRSVLRRADQIVVLKAGSVEAVGQLEELLETCVEMRRLWQGDVD